jgi:hypothetical protein
MIEAISNRKRIDFETNAKIHGCEFKEKTDDTKIDSDILRKKMAEAIERKKHGNE